MKSLLVHAAWIRSDRHLKLSLSLFIVLFLLALAYSQVLISLQKIDDAAAQPIVQSTKSEEVSPAKTESVQQATEQATEQPAAQAQQPVATTPPAPVQPTPAVTPAPTYDKVAIPSIGLSSRYVSVGLTATNNIDVHPTLVGLYSGRSQPGTPGAVFLDGHNPGVFSNLPSISTGAVITITKASNETFNYTVVHTETVQLEGINMRKALSVYPGYTEGLNLMTCVGTFIPQINTTDQRFVVYTVRS
ncbi:MAG: sortase [Candidatus Microsaccharimonas sp.]